MSSFKVDQLVRRKPGTLERDEQRRLIAGVQIEHWHADPDALLGHVEHLLHIGHHRDALDLLIRTELSSLRVRQLRAWALRASGAPQAAAAILASLRQSGATDVETLGLSGSVEKDLARFAIDEAEAERHRGRAREFYLDAFEQSGDYWTGINAAILSLRCELPQEARKISERVAEACRKEIERGAASYYALATLAQATLILGNDDTARAAYQEAAKQPDASRGKIGRDRSQLQELLLLLNRDPVKVADALPASRVIVFSGNRIDAAGRDRGFDSAAAARLRAALDRYLDDAGVGMAFTAAADGADIIFLEALADRGAESHVVLPTDVASFREWSVIADWRTRFDAVIEQAESLTITGDGIDEDDPANLIYCAEVTLGMARMKAREMSSELSAIAVWDGNPGAAGGTADSIALWQESGIPTTVFHPASKTPHPTSALQPPNAVGRRRTMAMLKADVVGYSRLKDTEVAAFYADVLPPIAKICDAHAPLVRNTFGDAFYFVFEQLQSAAEFAFALRSLFRSTPLGIRIAIHAGPLLECYDPVRDAVNYTGRHSSRAARVEPVADENQILATQQFAALCMARDLHGLEFVYAGERSLPKNFGSERVYVMTRC